jgi:hypothetical protein
LKGKAFKTAFTLFVVSAAITEFFCGTFYTVVNYFVVDLENTTEGVVIKSETKWSSGGPISVLTYDIEYEYTIGGMRYKSTRVTHGRSDENPYKILNRYPVSKIVTVYYDSSRPDFSVLEITGLSAKTYRQLGGLAFLFFLAFFWILREERK